MTQDPLSLLVLYALLLAGLAVGPWVIWYLFGVTVDYIRRKLF